MSKTYKAAPQTKSDMKGSGKSEAKSGSFRDRDLKSVNPLKEQFEPTDSEPVRQRARMAGTC